MMTTPADHAEHVQTLRNTLRDHGLTEEDTPEAEHSEIRCNGDGSARLTEFTEEGPLVSTVCCPCPRHAPTEEDQ